MKTFIGPPAGVHTGDVEMSFISPEDIYELMEGLMRPHLVTVKLGIEVPTPFPECPTRRRWHGTGVTSPIRASDWN